MSARVPILTRAVSALTGYICETGVRCLPSGRVGNAGKYALLKLAGSDCAWPLHISSGVWVRKPRNLRCGRGVVISRGAVLNCSTEMVLGDGVLVGYYAYIGTAAHRIPESIDARIIDAGHEHSPDHIRDGCWIGAHACVLPGVELGRGAVIGAGAVVTQSADAGSICVGVPARVIRVRGAVERGRSDA